ncbi:MAG: hypothetical protein OEZ32_03305 [Nitrospinota bacterium]|nr:hypothetical protein [Nitrospinota bacterium]
MIAQDLSGFSKMELEHMVLSCQAMLEEYRQIIEYRTERLGVALKEAERYRHEAKRAREQLAGARARFKRKLRRSGTE